MSPSEGVTVAIIGIAGGMAGGMLGIGGSLIFIPALTIALGPDQQRYQAAAMIINAVVAATATYRHGRAGVIRPALVLRILPAAIIAILTGVALSNRMPAQALQVAFGCFLILLAAYELRSILGRGGRGHVGDESRARLTWGRLSTAGGAMGLPAGLLGIGGGLVLVPLLNGFVRLPLRQAIGTSSAVILVASLVGAIAKNLNLGVARNAPLAVKASEVLPLAGLLLPGAVAGALVGATLTHRLPTRWVKLALVLLLALAAEQMIARALA